MARLRVNAPENPSIVRQRTVKGRLDRAAEGAANAASVQALRGVVADLVELVADLSGVQVTAPQAATPAAVTATTPAATSPTSSGGGGRPT